jgi:hypothetical protein
MVKISEQLLIQVVEKTQCIAVGCEAMPGSESGNRIVGLNTLQIGPRTDKVMRMIDRQHRRFRHHEEIEGIATQGLDLHGYLDIEVVYFLLEPDLGHPVSLQVEMLITPQRYRTHDQLMADDSLRSIVARMKT